MKKDNFDNKNITTNNSSTDMGSMLKLLKMMSSQKESTPNIEATEPSHIEEPLEESVPLSRTTERVLALMASHDEAIRRIANKKNKNK